MKTLVQIICGFVFLVAGSHGASAQNFRETGHNGFHNNGLYAGFYLRVPLGGSGREGFSQKLNYGFAAGPSFEMRETTFDPTGRPMLRAHVIDLNFSARGFERFSLAGTTLLGTHRFDLVLAAEAGAEEGTDEAEAEDGDEDGKKRGVGSTILMVAGGVFIAIIVFALASSCGDKVIDKDKDKFLDSSDFCPV